MTEEQQQKGKIASMTGALKKLLAEDPLLFIVAVACLLPILLAIVSNALAMNWNLTIGLVFVESGVVIFVIIPLTVTKTWKENNRDITEERREAIKNEAQVRLINEKNKQKRFNEVTEAKLVNLQAQTQFILDQSDRQERKILKQSLEDLRKYFEEDLPFVNREEHAVTTAKVLEEINDVHIKYDEVLVSVNRIETALNAPKQKTSAVEVAPFILSPDLVEKTVERQKEDNFEVQKKLDEVATHNIQTLWPKKSPAEVTELKAAMSAVDNLEDNKAEPATPLPSPEAYDSIMKNYWTCKYCNNDNPLKAPRCRKCSKGKVQPS